MTRPMTKAQLSLMADRIDRQLREDSFVRFLMEAVVFGAAIGTGIATLVLFSDTFGLFTLIRGQSDSIAASFAFIISGAMTFAPISLAAAVGLAARPGRVFGRLRFATVTAPDGADWSRS